MSQRFSNWEARLFRVIEGSKDKPFAWGRHDCCHFAAACVEAMTGENPMRPFSGKYDNKKTARKVLADLGNGSLLKTLTGVFGPPVSASFARRGDLAYLSSKNGPSVGICLGRVSYFVGETLDFRGLVTFPTLEISRFFRV